LTFKNPKFLTHTQERNVGGREKMRIAVQKMLIHSPLSLSIGFSQKNFHRNF
jgi:hypothetical protein